MRIPPKSSRAQGHKAQNNHMYVYVRSRLGPGSQSAAHPSSPTPSLATFTTNQPPPNWEDYRDIKVWSGPDRKGTACGGWPTHGAQGVRRRDIGVGDDDYQARACPRAAGEPLLGAGPAPAEWDDPQDAGAVGLVAARAPRSELIASGAQRRGALQFWDISGYGQPGRQSAAACSRWRWHRVASKVTVLVGQPAIAFCRRRGSSRIS